MYKYNDLYIYVIYTYIYISEGGLDVKLPTVWADGKAEMGRVREEKESVERRSEKRKSPKKEDAGARQGRKVAKHCFFSNDRRSKSRLGCGAIWPNER